MYTKQEIIEDIEKVFNGEIPSELLEEDFVGIKLFSDLLVEEEDSNKEFRKMSSMPFFSELLLFEKYKSHEKVNEILKVQKEKMKKLYCVCFLNSFCFLPEKEKRVLDYCYEIYYANKFEAIKLIQF